MAVPSEAHTVSYAGNDVATRFPVPFRFDDPPSLVVTRTASDGTEDLLAFPLDFLATVETAGVGGTVVLPAPLAAGETLTIRRVVPAVQSRDLGAAPFEHGQLEAAHDYLTFMDQELERRIADAEAELPALVARLEAAEAAAAGGGAGGAGGGGGASSTFYARSPPDQALASNSVSGIQRTPSWPYGGALRFDWGVATPLRGTDHFACRIDGVQRWFAVDAGSGTATIDGLAPGDHLVQFYFARPVAGVAGDMVRVGNIAILDSEGLPVQTWDFSDETPGSPVGVSGWQSLDPSFVAGWVLGPEGDFGRFVAASE